MPERSDGNATAAFYAALPVFRNFSQVVDEALYRPLPDGWSIGVADVEHSTRAILQNRYKAVNMAGAAVIVAVANALRGRDFPFVFGGDGASFAVAEDDVETARGALAATATWVKEELDLSLRVALVPVAALRAAGADVLVARYAPSEHISIATFSGGGMAWVDTAMKQGQFAVVPAPPHVRPDLSGLSCRYELIPASRGLVLSLVVVPAPGASSKAFRAVVEDVARIVQNSAGGSRPVPGKGLRLRWPPQGLDMEARARRTAGTSLLLSRLKVLALTLVYFLIMSLGIRIGAFVPRQYTRQVVDNSDFRKFDDALRMVLDCNPQIANEIERRLDEATAAGTVRYGVHRQDKAMMTCFAPSPASPNHIHFIDGALGGYALAASALKGD